MPITYEEVLFRVDSTLKYAVENRHSWNEGMKRSPRMYPTDGADPAILFDEFLTYVDSNDWGIYTVADFAYWLKTRKIESRDARLDRIAPTTSAKVDTTDERQRAMLARIEKIQAAKAEMQQMQKDNALAGVTMGGERGEILDPEIIDPETLNKLIAPQQIEPEAQKAQDKTETETGTRAKKTKPKATETEQNKAEEPKALDPFEGM